MLRINRPGAEAGFTLIEVVVIAPVLILTLGGFIVALVSMVGDTLANRDTNTMLYEAQSTLDRIEQDVRLSKGYLATTGTLPSPQGSDGTPAFTGTAAFTATSSNYLLLSTLSTNVNPLDPARKVVYYGGTGQPYGCGSLESYNTPFPTTVIYYLNGTALYRRTVVPSNTLTAGQANTVCYTPWQQNSCSPGYTNTTQCATQDAKVMDNVKSIGLAYYASQSSNTDLGASNAPAAITIGVTITTEKTTAGQLIGNSTTARFTRLNLDS